MTRTGAAGMRILALAILGAAGLGLAGCGTIDNALFGGGTGETAQPPANAAPRPAQQQAAQQPPATAPAPQPAPVAAPAPPPVATAPLAPPPVGGEFTPVTVQPGADTGTTVSHTIASLRSQLEALESKLAANAQHFTDLRSTGSQDAASYQGATGEISARLSAGTTRGNPELISQWNTAQGALDSLTGNINALGQLASDVSKDASDAHQEFDTIQSTFDVSGAVDEDHRQLSVLSDETGQTIVLLDRLLREVKQTLERQTAYVAAERGHLTTLADLIKAGNYAPFVASRAATASPRQATRTRTAAGVHASATDSNVATAIAAGGPIITIKFNRAHVSYDHALYSALSQALAAKPSANFDVVGVSPGSADASQSGADQDAEAVMRSMGEMGVPATRMSATSSSDPAIAAAEVRVYAK
jgi:hypothetical protein